MADLRKTESGSRGGIGFLYNASLGLRNLLSAFGAADEQAHEMAIGKNPR